MKPLSSSEHSKTKCFISSKWKWYNCPKFIGFNIPVCF